MECGGKAKPHPCFGCPGPEAQLPGCWDSQSGDAGPAALCRRTPQTALLQSGRPARPAVGDTANKAEARYARFRTPRLRASRVKNPTAETAVVRFHLKPETS
ncbi:MAG: hypothetical protein Kow00109_19520 [Acidobacteriota bacterium]